MVRFMLAAAVVACSAAMASVGSAAPINAKTAFTITIECPSGTYESVVNGNGEFTPAHSLDSNTVLIPIAFGTFTGTFTDPNGVTSTDTEPPVTKGAAVPANGLVEDCTYSFRLSFPNGSSFAGSGSVTGFIPGT
jgi:hypothetical protein